VGWGKDDKNFEKWWPADVHVIGKGISRFHTLYWPAMLLSAGIPLPKTIFIHGYITAEGQKMSKSVGNVIDPFEIIRKYGADVLRYYLINEIPSFDDGDFSEDRLVEKTNNELIGNFGNFVFRTISFLKANFNSTVPEPDTLKSEEKQLVENIKKTKEKIYENMQGFKLRESLHAVLELASLGNQYFQNKKPWDTLKKDPENAANTLYIATNLVRTLAVFISPFLPSTSEKLWEQLNLGGDVHKQKFGDADKLMLEPGHRIGDISPLFKKIED
jgi:methionyl-tRNA synthetase